MLDFVHQLDEEKNQGYGIELDRISWSSRYFGMPRKFVEFLLQVCWA